MTEPWTIAWDYGCAEVHALGGMLGPVCYRTGSGREVQPFFLPPWMGEEEAGALTGLLRGLRGEWPCVPFGVERAEPVPGWEGTAAAIGDGSPHGHGANHDWQLIDRSKDWVLIGIDYPAGHPVRRLKRRIAGRNGEAALDLELEVEAAWDIDLCLGLHPTFRLPEATGMAEIEIAGSGRGLTFPAPLDASSHAAPGQWFDRLDQVPGRTGAAVDFSRQPFAIPNEDLLQLQATGGSVRLLNHEEGWAARIDYDPDLFPSLVLWVSNRGWTSYPWSGRTRVLGIEPARAVFDLGQPVSADPANPLAQAGVRTSVRLAAGDCIRTAYAISVEDVA